MTIQLDVRFWICLRVINDFVCNIDSFSNFSQYEKRERKMGEKRTVVRNEFAVCITEGSGMKEIVIQTYESLHILTFFSQRRKT